MGVSILIVTHGSIGQAILDTASKIIGSTPMTVKALSIDMDSDCESSISQINEIANEINCGDGVLVLTDLFGATPSNIASTINIDDCIVVAGLNLPMLIRVMNYHSLPLFELSDKAVGGGKDGVLAYYLDKNKTNATNTN